MPWCIQDTQNRDLMQGVAPDTFRPEGTLSRAMAATLLWRLAGTPQPGQPSAFLDVPRDAWYTQAVDWAGGSRGCDRSDPHHLWPQPSR